MSDRPKSSGTRIAGFSVNNPVPMNLLFIVLVVVSVIVMRGMPVDVYPDVSLGEATLDTFWLGASAEDVERLITDRIEDEIQDNHGIAWIVSDSKPDASLIRVKFRENLTESGLDAAIRELRASVEQVTDLPEDAEEPVVTKLSMREVLFLLWVTVVDEGDVGEEVLHDVAMRLKPLLREIPGVAKVDDLLIRDREVHIKADRDALRKHNLTLQDLTQILMQYNRDLPSGTIQKAESELSIRARGGVASPDELASIVVRKDPAGGHIYLRDVATIETDFARKTFFARCNLNECLALGIAKTDEADSRQVASRIREALPAFEAALPPGVGLEVFNDTSDIISSRLHVLTNNLISGVVLVFVALLVAIGMRNALLAIIGIPFSFGCALICMQVLGVTINAVSLIGLVLCGGMIVDDAIVVLENIYRHVEERRAHSDGPGVIRQAVIDGTGEVFWPVASSSATTIVAFMPLLLMPGVMGNFFAIIPKTVAVVLLASLFECLLCLPVHYVEYGYRRRKKKAVSKATDVDASDGEGRPGLGTRLYDRCLAVALRNRHILPIPVIALAYLAYAASPLIAVELFPSDLQTCFLDVQTADEASLDQTGAAVRPIEELALTLTDQVSGVLTSYGLALTEENAVKLRNNVAQINIQLARVSQIDTDPTSVIKALREEIEKYLAAHPESGIQSFRIWSPLAGPPVGKPVYIRIQCPDFRASKQLAERYKARLDQMDGVFGIHDNLEFGRQQINLTINEDRASVHGLTFMTLASVLRTANDGMVVSTFKDTHSGEDLDVRLRLDDRYCRDVDDLMDLDVRSPLGHVVQVRQIAGVEVDQGYAGIPHYNGKRVVIVSAEVDTNRTTAQEVNERLQREFEPILATQPNVRVTYGGQFAEAAVSFSSLREAFVIALVLIYFLLATQFRSYMQPAIVISTVPFACVGVVGGLLLGGYSFTVMTFIAIVGLSGVVVNDSILLVDCMNARRDEHDNLLQAVRAACRQRLRPVLLTTITTVFGLLPLAIGIGGKSRIWSPFASSFAWGLAFATLVTLFMVPAVYCIVDDLARLVRRGRTEVASLAPPPATETTSTQHG